MEDRNGIVKIRRIFSRYSDFRRQKPPLKQIIDIKPDFLRDCKINGREPSPVKRIIFKSACRISVANELFCRVLKSGNAENLAADRI